MEKKQKRKTVFQFCVFQMKMKHDMKKMRDAMCKFEEKTLKCLLTFHELWF